MSAYSSLLHFLRRNCRKCCNKIKIARVLFFWRASQELILRFCRRAKEEFLILDFGFLIGDSGRHENRMPKSMSLRSEVLIYRAGGYLGRDTVPRPCPG